MEYIERNRRLLRPGVDPNMIEYYDKILGSRIIAMHKDSRQAGIHEELVNKRLPVFSAIYRDNELQLTVPEGTRSLQRGLRFIARDIHNYGEIFKQLGVVLHELQDSRVGAPEPAEQRTFLDNFAFSNDDQSRYGGRVYLVPPYWLNPIINHAQALDFVGNELRRSELFRPDEVDTLLQWTERGWQDE